MSDLGPLDGCLRVYYKPFGRGYNLRRAKQEPNEAKKGGTKKKKEKIAASKTTGRMAAFIHSAKCLLPYPANPFLFSFFFWVHQHPSYMCVRPSSSSACAGAAVGNFTLQPMERRKVVHNSITSTHRRERKENPIRTFRLPTTLFYIILSLSTAT